jgi:hypothetical protein
MIIAVLILEQNCTIFLYNLRYGLSTLTNGLMPFLSFLEVIC